MISLSNQEKQYLLNADIGTPLGVLDIKAVVNNELFEGYSYTISNRNRKYIMLNRPIQGNKYSSLVDMIRRGVGLGAPTKFLFETNNIKSDILNLNEYLPTPLMIIDTLELISPSTPKLTPRLYNWESSFNIPITDPSYQYTRTSWGEFRSSSNDNSQLYLDGKVYERITTTSNDDPTEIILIAAYIKQYEMGVLKSASYYGELTPRNLILLFSVSYEHGYIRSVNVHNDIITRLDLFNEIPYYISHINGTDHISYEFISPGMSIYLSYNKEGSINIQYSGTGKSEHRHKFYRSRFGIYQKVPDIIIEYIPIKGIVNIIKDYFFDSRQLIYMKKILEDLLIKSNNDVTLARINQELTTINLILE